MKARLKQSLLVLLDLIAINITLLLAFLLRFEWAIPKEYVDQWLIMAIFFSSIRLLFFAYFGLYRSIWRYSSMGDLVQIVKAVTISSIVIWTIIIPFPIIKLPRSIGVITWLLNILIIGAIRFAFRLKKEIVLKDTNNAGKRRVLVIGAGNAGAMITREMLLNDSAGLKPIAFLDDSLEKLHRSINGIPVVGRINQLKEIIAQYHPDDILIAIPSASKERMREIISTVNASGLPMKTLPNLMDLSGPNITIGQIRDVKIEDLLGREPISLDVESIAGYLRGERVMITGAGGSIGSELCRQVAKYSPEALILLGRGENSIYEIDQELTFTYGKNLKKAAVIADIRDRQKLEQVFRIYQPTVVFHAAAHKHVPLMEMAPDEAVKNNVFGTKNVAELSDRYHIKRFVLISTDKAVNPTSVMGATKRIAEIIVQSLARTSKTKFCAVRFGNVLGSRGSVVPLFKKQIARGGPITITHPEMRRFFMTIPEAVSLVIQAGTLGKAGEIFILDMGEQVRILDLAKDLIRLSGLDPEKDIPIRISGIRPGEKLYEELLTDEEGTNHTQYKRIYVGKPNGVDWKRLPTILDELWDTAQDGDRDQIIKAIKVLVPKFRSHTTAEDEIAAGQSELKSVSGS